MRTHFIALAALLAPVMAQAELKIIRVHCEYAENPLGIDVGRPRLGWVMESPERGQRQTAYHMLAASSPEKLAADQGDLWDSGKVASADSIHVEYAGRPLPSGRQAWWKVRVWDQDGRPSAYSQPAWWETALLSADDWKARWICSPDPAPEKDEDFYAEHPAPLFRKEFDAGRHIVRARAYVTGLGYYELYLNGRRVGDHMLDPGWTTYSKRVLYSTYDVTDLLREGRNCAAALVGNGWYNPLPMRFFGRINLRHELPVGRPRLLAQIEVEHADGTREVIVTDESWKTGASALLKNSVYLGEVYDARREQAGWSEPGFDDSVWRNAVLSTEPVGRLQAQSAPPIRITRRLKAVKLSEPKPGIFIYDFGQNFAGWARLNVSAPAGTAIQMRYGELLYPDGTLNVMTGVATQLKSKGLGGPGAPDVAYQSDTYICKGGGAESYTPRFTFRGFRYVELTGLQEKPPLEALEGLRLNADVRRVGSFECSDPLFNRIHEIVQWTLLSNLFSVQSDCPHREKLGYGGDIVASSEMAMFNYDMAQFYAKAVRDLQDAARPNGGLTETAPYVGIADEGFGGGTGPIEWGTAHPVLLRQLYQYYGNLTLISEQFETAKRWVQFLQSQARGHLIEKGISDHESLVPKPVAVTGTAFYYLNVRALRELGAILGRDPGVGGDLEEVIQAAFLAKHYDAQTGAVGAAGQGRQCSQAIALYLNLVPDEQKSKALKVLVDDVLREHQGHLTTGIFGTKFMLSVLGRWDPEVAYTVVGQKDFPGFGYMLANGATTLWEHWAKDDNVYSHNHPMFGSVDEWFYCTVAGINPDPKADGFGDIVIEPRPGGDLTWARAEYDSIRGKIRSGWRIEGGVFRLKVAIPVNATAKVRLAVPEGAQVTESGKPIQGVVDGRAAMKRRTVEMAIGSGDYEFQVQPWVPGSGGEGARK